MNDFAYAEKFGCHPQEIERVVTLKWWERWTLYEQAQAARLAWKKAKRSTDWTKDLSAEERAAMEWAVEKDDG